jgi:hypothetical protein
VLRLKTAFGAAHPDRPGLGTHYGEDALEEGGVEVGGRQRRFEEAGQLLHEATDVFRYPVRGR